VYVFDGSDDLRNNWLMTRNWVVKDESRYAVFHFNTNAKVGLGFLDFHPVTETGHIKYDKPIHHKLPFTVESPGHVHAVCVRHPL
jgi:hypothetical protein